MDLFKCILTHSTCYQNTGTGSRPVGVLWHDTGAGNPNLYRYVQPYAGDADYDELIAKLGKNPYANDWNHEERWVGVHAFIGKKKDGEVGTVQTLPYDYTPMGCGAGWLGSCNGDGERHWLQFEICDDFYEDEGYFNRVYKEACEYTAFLCKSYGLDPAGTVSFAGTTVPVILCHQDSYQLGVGYNHGDVYRWFNRYGKTMDDVRRDVKAILDSGETPEEGAADEKPAETESTEVTVGALVSVAEDAVYYTGKAIPAWVKIRRWYVKKLSGDRAVIDRDESGSYSINSPVNVKYLSAGKKAEEETGKEEETPVATYDRQKVIDILLAEEGYLEKASNAELDDKTANAGYGNWTKYARDLDAISGFYNGKKNGYAWCDMFVDWGFVQAYGVEGALKLLCTDYGSSGAGCNCSANYFRAKGQFHTAAPEPGDQIFFGNAGEEGHTGLVYAVDGNYVYTIEGNTDSEPGVEANGGAVCRKQYALGSSYISGYGRPDYGMNAAASGGQTGTGTATNNKGDCTVTVNILQKGSAGAQVKAVQLLLIGNGYSCGGYGADGDFGAGTQAAVINFQIAKGLTADGVVGANTWGRLING